MGSDPHVPELIRDAVNEIGDLETAVESGRRLGGDVVTELDAQDGGGGGEGAQGDEQAGQGSTR